MVSGDGRLLVLPSPVDMQNIMDSLFLDAHTDENQHFRDGTVSFLLNQVPFTQSSYHVHPPSLPETHSCTRCICHQSSPRRASLYFTVHGTSDCFFVLKFSVAVQPLRITASELALQYWGDVVISPSGRAGAVTVWWKGLCITT